MNNEKIEINKDKFYLIVSEMIENCKICQLNNKKYCPGIKEKLDCVEALMDYFRK